MSELCIVCLYWVYGLNDDISFVIVMRGFVNFDCYWDCCLMILEYGFFGEFKVVLIENLEEDLGLGELLCFCYDF